MSLTNSKRQGSTFSTCSNSPRNKLTLQSHITSKRYSTTGSALQDSRGTNKRSDSERQSLSLLKRPMPSYQARVILIQSTLLQKWQGRDGSSVCLSSRCPNAPEEWIRTFSARWDPSQS